MTAEYLLRFDDLCPTMDRARWRRFAALVERFDIKPILAVVPDNQDPELRIEPADPEFWSEMRSMQSAGATVGLHGFQHLCVAEGRGLVPFHRQTEFAGAPLDYQREWIQAGMSILQDHGLEARVWVAPRHGLDRRTLVALRDAGIWVVSDGLAKQPYREYGVTWIPQQLWGPKEKRAGLWTICIHPNSASDELLQALEKFLGRFAEQFTSVERVVTEWPVRERSFADRLHHNEALLRIRLKQRLRG